MDLNYHVDNNSKTYLYQNFIYRILPTNATKNPTRTFMRMRTLIYALNLTKTITHSNTFLIYIFQWRNIWYQKLPVTFSAESQCTTGNYAKLFHTHTSTVPINNNISIIASINVTDCDVRTCIMPIFLQKTNVDVDQTVPIELSMCVCSPK